MADALCGPSNALQNFQKHSSVDRTLQQDRLVGRHTPSQGFRSINGTNAGVLDAEFEAFQAGHAGPSQLQPLDFHNHHLPPHLARAPQPLPPQFAQPPGAPDWASDFQRLSIGNQHAPGLQQERASPASAAWHQDFLSQQGPAQPQQNGFSGISGVYGAGRFGGPGFQQPMGFGGMNGGMMTQPMQGKQPVQDAVPQYDEAAFEQAFAQLDQDLAEHATEAPAQPGEVIEERPVEDIPQHVWTKEDVLKSSEAYIRNGLVLPLDLDEHLLVHLREKKPAVYAMQQLSHSIQNENMLAAAPYLTILERMEEAGELVADPAEARYITDGLQATFDPVHQIDQDLQTRQERLVRSINERLMSMYPMTYSYLNQGISGRAEMMVYPEQEQPQRHHKGRQLNILQSIEPPEFQAREQAQQQELEREQEKPADEQQAPQAHDDDEMADTAGRLLESVAHDTSAKFQNSQFLSLMRKLRDREVKVDGDKMVDVSTAPQSSSQLPPHETTTIPFDTAHRLPSIHSLSQTEEIGIPSSIGNNRLPHITSLTSSQSIPEIDRNILSHAATDFSLPVGPSDDNNGTPDTYASSSSDSSTSRTDDISGQYRHYNVHGTYHQQ